MEKSETTAHVTYFMQKNRNGALVRSDVAPYAWLITNDRLEIKAALFASACIAPYFFKNILSFHPPPAAEKIFKLKAAMQLLIYVEIELKCKQ